MNASLLTRIRTGVRALKVLRRDPTNPVYGPLLYACMDSTAYASLARAWRSSPGGARLLAQRPTLQGRELDLEALARLPAGTLGHEFTRYFRENGIEPFVTEFAVVSEIDYMTKRSRETHDLFHLITGYRTDRMGELELQAFTLGNLRFPSAALVLAFAAPLLIKRHGVKEVRPHFARLRAAYHRGARSRELLSVAYEELWYRPVAELCELLCAPA